MFKLTNSVSFSADLIIVARSLQICLDGCFGGKQNCFPVPSRNLLLSLCVSRSLSLSLHSIRGCFASFAPWIQVCASRKLHFALLTPS